MDMFGVSKQAKKKEDVYDGLCFSLLAFLSTSVSLSLAPQLHAHTHPFFFLLLSSSIYRAAATDTKHILDRKGREGSFWHGLAAG